MQAAITSDRGSKFTSAVWKALCQLLEIQHEQTTAYHPEGNGMMERFHCRLKDTLRARCAGPVWIDHFPLVMLGIRASPHKDTAITPSQAIFGSALVLPGQIVTDPETFLDNFRTQIKTTLSRFENLTTRHNTAAARIYPTELPVVLPTTTHVLVRWDGQVPPLAPLYVGPYTILPRAAQYFTIQMGDREEVVSTGRLKPCLTPQAVPAQLRCRGHPLGSLARSGLPPCHPGGPVLTPPGSAKPDETRDLLPTQPLRSGGLDCLPATRGSATSSSPP